MLHSFEVTILAAALLMLLSVAASTASSRFGIPALVLFMAVGMLAGTEGLGGIEFSDYNLARAVGTIALVLILFSGGLETPWDTIRPVLAPGVLLATIGVVLTALVIGVAAVWLLGIEPMIGFLIGAIISSTDAAAVFGVLRARGLQLRGRLAPLLEFESGANDPMAVLLTVTVTSLILDPSSSFAGIVPDLVQQLLLGSLGGALCGEIIVITLNKVRIDYEGLYPVVSTAAALLTYAGVALLGGSGFVAVYVAGVVIGSQNFLHKISLLHFHDGVAWLMQIVMFLTLGLLVIPSQILEVAGPGIGLALIVIFVARPIAVFISLLPIRSLDLRNRIFVSWVGLRGAVPIVLATIPLTEGVPGAQGVFNAVFFVVLASVVLQGTTIRPVARLLGVLGPTAGSVAEKRVHSSMFQVTIESHLLVAGKRVVDLRLPRSALIVLLTRDGESYVPRGATVLQPGDNILVATRKDDLEELKHFFSATTQQGAGWKHSAATSV